MQQIVQKELQEAVQTIYLKEKANTRMIYYVIKWMKTLSLIVSSFASTTLSHCFSLLFAFLTSKTFRNNYMHCEIIDRYFNVFFIEIQLKKENLKWAF